MQELVITNVKAAQYKEFNLNQLYDPENQHNHCYEFQNSYVTQPSVSGEGKLTVAFYTLQPGKSNYPYHYHTGAEEVFYIISGTATLKTSKGDVIVTEGDLIVMPPNENGAHMLTNHSDNPLVYIDIHTISSPEVIVYPDSGNVRVMSGKMQKSYKVESEVNYLDGE
jgi:uncharacterized cupin superfamily protein